MVIRPGRTMLDPGPGGTIRQVVIMEDPWQARLNRMRQLLPLPFLVLSAAITFTVPASAFHRWCHRASSPSGMPRAVTRTSSPRNGDGPGYLPIDYRST